MTVLSRRHGSCGGSPDYEWRAVISSISSIENRLSFTILALDRNGGGTITELRTSVTRDDGTVVLEGDAVCYTMPLE